EAGQLAALKGDLEYVMASNPWPNFRNPKTQQLAEEYQKRSGGRLFDTNSGYSYDAIFVVADVLERAAKLDDPDAIVDAIQKTTYSAGLMQYGGPIHFNEIGDNPNAIPTMIQILRQRPVAVWPKEAALQKFVFPRPRPDDRRDPRRAGPAQRRAVRRRVQPHGRRAHAHLRRHARGEL